VSVREKIARLMETELFAPEFDYTLQQLREVTHERALKIVEQKLFSVFDLQKYTPPPPQNTSSSSNHGNDVTVTLCASLLPLRVSVHCFMMVPLLG